MYEVTGKEVASALGVHEKKGRSIWNSVLDRFCSVHEINPEGAMIELGEVLRERKRLKEIRSRVREGLKTE